MTSSPAISTDVAPIAVLAWTIVVLSAWTGWGAAACRMLYPTRFFDADWGLLAAWGMAISIAVGGVLNLLDGVTRLAAAGVVVTGSALWLALCVVPRTVGMARRDAALGAPLSATTLAAAAVCTIGITKLIELVSRAGQFNAHDDYHAYLVFPVKMLQAGTLTADPFNASQMGSLGGQAFLQLLGTAAFPLPYISMIDPGACLLVCAALLLGTRDERSLTPFATLGIAAIALVAVDRFPRANVSAETTALALHIGLFRTALWIDGHARRERRGAAVMLGIVAAGAIALKSTAVPMVVLLLGLTHAAGSRVTSAGDELRKAATVVVSTLCALLPWMLVSHRSSGTLLFPYLGEGFRGTVYGSFPTWSDFSRFRDLLGWPMLLPVVSLTGMAWWLARSRGDARTAGLNAALGLSTVMGVAAILWASAGNARYTFPFTFAACLILGREVARAGEVWIDTRIASLRWHRNATDFAIAICFVLAAAIVVVPSFANNTAWRRPFRLAETPPLAELRAPEMALTEAQTTLPAGAAILAKVVAPFLLNFDRNPVYVVDWAHGSSPPPGMPLRAGSDVLATYLLDHQVRYVLYEYGAGIADGGARGEWWYAGGNERCRDPVSAAPILARSSGEHPEQAVECAMDVAAADFVRNLDELLLTRVRAFDDGNLAVIDLARGR